MASRQTTRRLTQLLQAIRRVPVTPGVSSIHQRLVLPSVQSRVPLVNTTTAFFHTSSSQLNSNIINIQDEDDFTKTVMENSKPVIVDFHASWCGPCKLLGPSLESLVSAQDGKVLLAKVDIDELGDVAIEHDVQAVPTVLAVKGGKIVDKFVGLKDDVQLESFVKKLAG